MEPLPQVTVSTTTHTTPETLWVIEGEKRVARKRKVMCSIVLDVKDLLACQINAVFPQK